MTSIRLIRSKLFSLKKANQNKIQNTIHLLAVLQLVIGVIN